MAGRKRVQLQGLGSMLCVLVTCTLCEYVVFGAAEQELRGDRHMHVMELQLCIL